MWSIAWADDEELEYLKRLQPDLEVLREAAGHPSWLLLNKQITANHNSTVDPVAAWRFYEQLPFDYPFASRSKPREPFYSPYSVVVYSNFWFVSLKNLTIQQMAKTAIALKRYELIHGKNPASLASLTPDFLPSIQLDFMDGQPRHCRLNADNSFTLYSIGHNLLDDGRDPRPEYADIVMVRPLCWTSIFTFMHNRTDFRSVVWEYLAGNGRKTDSPSKTPSFLGF